MLFHDFLTVATHTAHTFFCLSRRYGAHAGWLRQNDYLPCTWRVWQQSRASLAISEPFSTTVSGDFHFDTEIIHILHDSNCYYHYPLTNISQARRCLITCFRQLSIHDLRSHSRRTETGSFIRYQSRDFESARAAELREMNYRDTSGQPDFPQDATRSVVSLRARAYVRRARSLAR